MKTYLLEAPFRCRSYWDDSPDFSAQSRRAVPHMAIFPGDIDARLYGIIIPLDAIVCELRPVLFP